ncbi:uncharacterized protein KABA2_02S05170 [Maudiozyma barnettii]|uniref:Uncharacterized protein n=1 Tax=Maudiozyma barnettii TaxID=61262 RepID=A0A8H2VCL0_9SACH|nr:hypothetical protein [Kazachstania barnettii]CAB4252817.1 similar to Saccharomyces cerevisiae YNL050C Putative protein of unknown function [Kazachstania barnettii]
MSRAELFQDGNVSPRREVVDDLIVPEFEYVEVNNVEDSSNNDGSYPGAEQDQTADDRFEFFPLFTTEGLTKVDLNEHVADLEPVIQERPRSYYYTSYDDIEKNRFEEAGITYDQLLEMSRTPYNRYKEHVLDINKHNSTIEKQHLKEKKAKKRKPGKNQRLARNQAKLNIEKREELRKQLKKKFRKRGGKKNKKKEKLNPLLHAGATSTEIIKV